VIFFVYRVEYLEKSKHLQDQLRELRSEIEVLKVGEKQSELDQLHDEQVRLGETKYSTLRKVSAFPCLLPCERISRLSAAFKSLTDSTALFLTLQPSKYRPKSLFCSQVKSGSTKARVAFFEEL
jgi:hypothetical protein